mmetsp:Transcript_3772/g.11992  ORF Transcript_3772/g.11992 Transcript_3772/m.11992 type:complete len:277 (+) Transcript_3772:428-1258(+)
MHLGRQQAGDVHDLRLGHAPVRELPAHLCQVVISGVHISRWDARFGRHLVLVLRFLRSRFKQVRTNNDVQDVRRLHVAGKLVGIDDPRTKEKLVRTPGHGRRDPSHWHLICEAEPPRRDVQGARWLLLEEQWQGLLHDLATLREVLDGDVPGAAEEVVRVKAVLVKDVEVCLLLRLVDKEVLDIFVDPRWIGCLVQHRGLPSLLPHLYDDVGVRRPLPGEREVLRPEALPALQEHPQDANRLRKLQHGVVHAVIRIEVNGYARRDDQELLQLAQDH